MSTERKAVDVLAVWDAEILRYETSAEIDALTGSDAAAASLRQRCQPLREARAAVAEVFAERDRLANIVHSHEKQILRMTNERAEFVAAVIEFRASLAALVICLEQEAPKDVYKAVSERYLAADTRCDAALARMQGGQ